MHAYRRYVQEEMDRRGWTQADLARASGNSTAVISRIFTDDRDAITRAPDAKTVAGIARAYGVSDQIVWLRVAQAMGLPVGSAVTVGDPSLLSDDDLLHELAERLRRSGGPGATIHTFPGSGKTRIAADLQQAPIATEYDPETHEKQAAYAPPEPPAAEREPDGDDGGA